jgi:endonuclease/exonuclease/phosphatase family metal-dependent hydrolase
MSFNIRYGTAEDGDNSWQNRQASLLETVTSFDPDLLGTQECLLLQAKFLKAGLPNYGFVGVGRDDGAEGGEMCAIFYRKERFHKVDEGHFWLSETPEVVASRSWDSALPRITSWVKLRIQGADSVTFYFFNTHFDHMGADARLHSAGLLLQKMEQVCHGLPAVIAGDFNAPADSAEDGPYRVLAGSNGDGRLLIDTYRDVHPPGANEGTFNGFAGKTTGPRIDWILVSPHSQPVDAAIIRTERRGRYPSDHFPVTAVIELNAESGRKRAAGAQTQ